MNQGMTYAIAVRRAGHLVSELSSWLPRAPRLRMPFGDVTGRIHRAAGLAAVLLAFAALSPASVLTLVLLPESETAISPGGALQTIALLAAMAAILWLVAANGRLGEQLDEMRQVMPEAGATALATAARRRELEATIAELKDWRAKLERQAQLLAQAVDQSMQEKAFIEQHCQAKSERLMHAGHELRTPLNAVIGFSELMLGEVFGPLGHAKYRDYAMHVRDSGRKLLEAAHDILDLAGSAPGEAAAPHHPVKAVQQPARPLPAEDYARIAASLQSV